MRHLLKIAGGALRGIVGGAAGGFVGGSLNAGLMVKVLVMG